MNLWASRPLECNFLEYFLQEYFKSKERNRQKVGDMHLANVPWAEEWVCPLSQMEELVFHIKVHIRWTDGLWSQRDRAGQRKKHHRGMAGKTENITEVRAACWDRCLETSPRHQLSQANGGVEDIKRQNGDTFRTWQSSASGNRACVKHTSSSRTAVCDL